MTFRLGQKVVCIEDFAHLGAPGEVTPTVNMVYAVRDRVFWSGEFWIFLVEIRNPLVPTARGAIERPFSVDGFRPAVERKTDISAFHEILRSASQKERV